MDFPSLLAGQAPRASTKLADPAVHPLLKIGAVLDDLEAWHAAQHEPEAALEVRLERVRRLKNSFTEADQQKALRDHVEKLLPRHRDREWWAMGQALLVEMWRADDLVRAHELAKAGHDAYPSSLGGLTCLTLMKQIEAPDYQLEAMSSDAPNKRSILLTHKNLDKLYFRAWSLDLGHRIDTAKNYELLYGYEEVRKLVGSTRPVAGWSVSLPATPDYRSHKTYVIPPNELSHSGWYVIVASAREDFAERQNRMMGLNFIVSNLVMVTRSDGNGGVEVRVVQGATGKPAAGATVDLYRSDWQKSHTRADSKKTDGDGLVSFGSGGYGEGGSYFVMARAGDEVALDVNHIYFRRQRAPGELAATLVYTDRAIYRPTQKLFWKIVAYRGRADEGKYKVSPSAAVTVRLHDPNGQEVDKREVTTNSYGSAAGEFVIPTGRLLGNWTVQTTLRTGGSGSSAQVRVEEYKRPTFEVSFKPASAPMRLNRAATLTGEKRAITLDCR